MNKIEVNKSLECDKSANMSPICQWYKQKLTNNIQTFYTNNCGFESNDLLERFTEPDCGCDVCSDYPDLCVLNCGVLCANTPNCTHFAWNDKSRTESTFSLFSFKNIRQQSGTCYMKYGKVNYDEAHYTGTNRLQGCGVIMRP